MKRNSWFLLVLFPLLFSACLIKSFNPFYTAEDVISDERVLGNWVDQDGNNWVFEPFKSLENTVRFPQYLMKYTEEGGKTSRFLTTFFTLNDEYYLDFFPDLEVIADYELLTLHTLPVHSLAKVTLNDNAIDIKWFNEEWMYKLIKAKKTNIQHELIRYDLSLIHI